MLEQILRVTRNWFPIRVFSGAFHIEAGCLILPELLDGQYFRVIGSVFNDGLHRSDDALTNETFEGAVWLLAIPADVLQLADEVADWQKQYGSAAAGPYQSESFGGYSYTRATDAKTGGAVTWETVFRDRLACYMRPRDAAPIAEVYPRYEPPDVRPRDPLHADVLWR